MATLKKAKRILKRVNGKLTVVYVDAETGQELSSLDGYELASQDGFSQGYGAPTAKPTEPEAQPAPTSSSSSNGPKADFWTNSDWIKSPTRSKGTGDILGDFKAAGETLNQRMNDLKTYIGDGVKNTVGRVAAALIPEDQRNAAVQGAANSAKDAAVSAATNVADKVTGALGGFFGGGSGPSQGTGMPTSPNEMFTYGNIAVRKMPLSNDWFDQAAAAATSVNPDIRFQISSAGQTAERGPNVTKGVDYTGGHRHNVGDDGQGHTADIHPYLNGEKITYDSNPALYKDLVTAFATVGFTGIGIDQDKGYLHVGGGSPAVWVYKGANDVPAPPDIQAAFDLGVQKNAAGEGEVIKQAYTDQVYGTNKSATKLANAPQVDQTINPNLRDAVTAYKGTKGQQVVNPTPVAQQQPLQPIPQSPINEAFSYAAPKTAPLVQQPVQQVAQVPQQTATQAIEAFAPQPQRVDTGQMQGFMPIAPATPAIETQTSPLMSNLLSAINFAEGSPDYNTLFGDGTFDDMSKHPNEKVYYNQGADFSTAAGKYQINKDTFNDYGARLGISTFTEDDQERLATAIAQDRYKAKTGGDLETDLQNPDNLEGIFNALAGTWSSLPAGVQARTKFDELKTFFDYGNKTDVGSKELVRPASNFMGSEPTSLQSVTKTSAFMPSDDPKTVAKQSAVKAESKSSGSSGVTPSASAAKAAEKAATSSSSSSSSGPRAGGLSGYTSSPSAGRASSSGTTTSGGFMSGTSSSKVKSPSTPSQSTSSTSTGGRSTSGTTTQTSTKDKSTSTQTSSSSSKDKSKTK